MTPVSVSSTETDAPPIAGEQAETPVDAAALQSQIDELKEQVAESTRTAEFWAERAKAAQPPPAAPVRQPEPEEEEDDTDVLEAITTGGTKGLNKILKKAGFVTRDEAASMVETRAKALTKENDLIGQYPDLKNSNSEFFKATALHYGELVKEGIPQTAAMSLAAEKAELQFIRGGKIKLGADGTKEDREVKRLARVDAQSGAGNNRRPAAADPEDENLDAGQLHVVRSMLVGQPGADGKPMNEAQAIERYKARAKAGVAMRVK